MNRHLHIICILLTAAVFIAPLSAAAQQTDTDDNTITVYKVNSAETALETDSIKYESSDTFSIIEQLISAYNEDSEKENTPAFLPPDARILSWELTDENVLALNFGAGYRDLPTSREVLIRGSIVKTFSQLQDIQAVHFYVDNDELRNQKGEEHGDMTADTFIELFSSNGDSYRYDTFTLYFTDKNGTHLLPETRRVYYRSSISKARVALEQLAKGPIDKGHYPTIPDSTELKSIILSDKVCYADFDRVFVDQQLDIDSMTVIGSVVNTVIANTSAEKVEISIAGNNDAKLKDDTDLYNFYQWNEELIPQE